MFLDIRLNIGLTSDEVMPIFITPFVTILSFLMFFPALRKEFVKWFVLDKKRLDKTICYPVLASILLGFIINIYRFVPYWFGYDVVGVGKKQVTVLEDVSDLGMAIGVYIIAPFSEEFLFRFLAFAGAALWIKNLLEGTKWQEQAQLLFAKKRKLVISSWVVITNLAFSFMHGPDLLSFPLYFLGGMVDAIFFIRFGFLSAWISHGSFNFFSGILLSIIISFLRA